MSEDIAPAPGNSLNTARSSKKAKAERRKRGSRVNIFAAIARFVREVIDEMRKVIPPTRNELKTYTMVVCLFVMFIMLIVFLLDLGLGKLILWTFTGDWDIATSTVKPGQG